MAREKKNKIEKPGGLNFVKALLLGFIAILNLKSTGKQKKKNLHNVK